MKKTADILCTAAGHLASFFLADGLSLIDRPACVALRHRLKESSGLSFATREALGWVSRVDDSIEISATTTNIEIGSLSEGNAEAVGRPIAARIVFQHPALQSAEPFTVTFRQAVG